MAGVRVSALSRIADTFGQIYKGSYGRALSEGFVQGRYRRDILAGKRDRPYNYAEIYTSPVEQP